MPLSVGQIALGRYRVEATSAVGGLVVVDAVDVRSGSSARLLGMDAGGPATPVDVERVLVETNRYRIGTLGIARPITAGWEGETLVVAYERPAGLPLGVAAPPSLSEFLRGVARALSPLHDQGIAHGCLCPDLLRESAGKITVDGFGFETVARACFGAAVAAEAQPGPCRAPERKTGAMGPPAPQADIYALGVIVSEILADRTVPDDSGAPTPRVLGAKVSDEVERVVSQALARSESDRPDDVSRWAEELAALLDRDRPHEKQAPTALQVPAAEPPPWVAPPAPSAVPLSETLEAAAPVPEAQRASASVPEAQRAPAPVPEAQRASASAPETLEAAAPVPEAQRAPAPDARVPARVPVPPAFSGGEAPPVSVRTRRTGLLSVLAIAGGALLMILGVGALFAYAMLRTPSVATAPVTAGAAGAPAAPAVPAPSQPDDAGSTGPVEDAGEPLDAGSTSSADGGGPLAVPSLGGSSEAHGLLPVAPDVPLWGTSRALVTVVLFGDLECPHTRRTYRVLEAVVRAFPDEVRVAFRHRPLTIHPLAKDAARVAAGIRQDYGDTSFWRFVSAASAGSDPASRANLEAWTTSAGADSTGVATWLSRKETLQEVERDLVLSGLFDVRETPTFFLNGARFAGYRDFVDLKPAIEKEIGQARGLLTLGAALSDLYATRVRKNLVGVGSEIVQRSCPPVSGSPARGPSDALVTIVEFSDFQCPFCKRVQPTLETILARHGGDVRLVWKQFPLAFHPRARPAAAFSLEAFARGGAAKFWKVHDLLFDNQSDLGETTLADIASRTGLDQAALLDAARTKTHDPKIEADLALGQKLGVRGTPAFFINGRALSGAQPVEKFSAVVTEELDAARRLVSSGTPRSRVYDALCGPR